VKTEAATGSRVPSWWRSAAGRGTVVTGLCDAQPRELDQTNNLITPGKSTARKQSTGWAVGVASTINT
jgi:hypothetical protein